MNMKLITAVKNPLITAARKLDSAKERRLSGTMLLDGEHMVGEALSVCPDKVRTVFVTEDCTERFAPLLSKAPAGCECVLVAPHVMEALSQVKSTQGIAAVCALPDAVPPEQQQGMLVLCENVQDPGNIGTILRTADAAGFAGAVLTAGCADPFCPKALRATMGSVFRVPISFVPDAADAVKALNARGFETIGASLTGTPYYERGPLGDRLCLLIGNEGAGLTATAQSACTRLYRLPMHGGAESLNAAIAAAVMMYDLVNR